MEMAADNVVETVIVGNYEEMENEGKPQDIKSKLSNVLWHGGSAYDAWFSCASNQVAQVLLTLPYSFSQLGMLSGILFQLFYGLLGSWTAYLISILYVEYRTRKEREKVNFRSHVIQWFEVLDGLLGKHWRNVGLAFNCTFLLFGSIIQLIACASNIYYINDNLDKRTWTYIFGACCATTVFIPSFHNYRIWSFLGLVMTTYTAWYLTIAAILHGQMEGVKHSGPNKMVLYFTGATNILYTFGGHAVTVEIMHAMWKPQKFKAIYLMATLYVLTLTLPSAVAVYWAFCDMLLNHSNAFAPKPSSGPHKSRECLPLILILRNRLKYALTYREVIAILMQRHVLVDGKVRTDKTYPAGFMDVVSIPKTNENFRLLYDTKGRFRLHSVRDDEAKFKLCKVRSVQFGQKGIPYLNTYDGRTIRYPDPVIRANDTIKLDLEENKIVDFIKFDVGNVVMVTGGRNRGRVGVIKSREKHKGTFETIHVQDATGHEFATRLGNVFTIGKGTKPWVSLPKGKGIKLTVIEEARKRAAAAQQAVAA